MSADAVVLGAGSSARMGGADKLLADLDGEPVIVWSLRAFEACQGIRSVVVTTSDHNEASIREAVARAGLVKVRAFVRGGSSRAQSVLHGLRALDRKPCETPVVREDPEALPPSPEGEGWGEGSSGLDRRDEQRSRDREPPHYVAVHDGARPLVTPMLIEDGLRMARVYGAAVAAVPATDTLKIVDRERLVVRTPIRSSVWHAQTPQFSRFADLLGAHERQTAMLDLYTDDVSVLEAEGLPVRVFEGSRENLKITTPDDLDAAARIVRQRRAAAAT
ncbi:MAG: IspD/TarI family cytidylyltransferase [Chloroflexi bacterium]|nr:IspD/TarI family cytidylyltransferase [Chloroflexota bacterium]